MKKLSAITIIFTLFLVSCEDSTEPDTTLPTIIITNPVDGSTLTEPVTIKVEATDNESVAMVEFVVDGETIGAITSAPFDFAWNVSFWADGDVHTILAKATDPAGNVGLSDLISVTVSTTALSLSLLSPLPNEIIRDANVITTRWRSVTDVVNYKLEVSTDPNFSVIAYSDSSADTTSTTSALTQDSHYWRVSGTNDIGEKTPWSSVSVFSLDGPEAPDLINPTLDSVFVGVNSLTIEWNSSEFATLYEANISIASDFASNEFEDTTAGTALVTSTLLDNGKRYWRVRAQNSVGFWGDWSSSSTFFLSDVIIFANTIDFIDFGGNAPDIGNSVQQTTDGGYIIIGTAENTENSVLLIKTDENGDEEWIRPFSNVGSTNGNSGQQTADGGYIITGISFFGGDNVWLIKTDGSGIEEWSKTFGGSGFDEGKSVQQTSDGGYIITGSTSSFGAGESDVWLIKTDANGTEEWNKTFGSNNTDGANSVQQTTDGGYIIGGYTLLPSSMAERDAWLIKTDADGTEEWNKIFPGSFAEGKSVEQTADGGYFLVIDEDFLVRLIKTDGIGVTEWIKTFGVFMGNENYAPYFGRQTSDGGYIITGGLQNINVSNYFDILLLKVNASGTEEWSKTYGGSGKEQGRSVQQTSDGGYIITGKIDDDVWLIKTDSEGNSVF